MYSEGSGGGGVGKDPDPSSGPCKPCPALATPPRPCLARGSPPRPLEVSSAVMPARLVSFGIGGCRVSMVSGSNVASRRNVVQLVAWSGSNSAMAGAPCPATGPRIGSPPLRGAGAEVAHGHVRQWLLDWRYLCLAPFGVVSAAGPGLMLRGKHRVLRAHEPSGCLAVRCRQFSPSAHALES